MLRLMGLMAITQVEVIILVVTTRVTPHPLNPTMVPLLPTQTMALPLPVMVLLLPAMVLQLPVMTLPVLDMDLQTLDMEVNPLDTEMMISERIYILGWLPRLVCLFVTRVSQFCVSIGLEQGG